MGPKVFGGPGAREHYVFDYSEIFMVLGWEDVEVQGGKFRVFKLEYKPTVSSPYAWSPKDQEINYYYWYSPDVK